jgi:hypothetical protein
MLTSFRKDDHMHANELMHQVEATIPAPIATMIAGELGMPSFRSSMVTVWYAWAYNEKPGTNNSIHAPFALRCDANGNWTIVTGLQDAGVLYALILQLLPDPIEIIEIRGREARSSSMAA